MFTQFDAIVANQKVLQKLGTMCLTIYHEIRMVVSHREQSATQMITGTKTESGDF